MSHPVTKCDMTSHAIYRKINEKEMKRKIKMSW